MKGRRAHPRERGKTFDRKRLHKVAVDVGQHRLQSPHVALRNRRHVGVSGKRLSRRIASKIAEQGEQRAESRRSRRLADRVDPRGKPCRGRAPETEAAARPLQRDPRVAGLRKGPESGLQGRRSELNAAGTRASASAVVDEGVRQAAREPVDRPGLETVDAIPREEPALAPVDPHHLAFGVHVVRRVENGQVKVPTDDHRGARMGHRLVLNPHPIAFLTVQSGFQALEY